MEGGPRSYLLADQASELERLQLQSPVVDEVLVYDVSLPTR
jgi:hypothetical protein